MSGSASSLVDRHQAAASWLPDIRLLIGDRELRQGTEAPFAHINPTTGRMQAEVPIAGAADVNAAVEAAVAGARVWRDTHPEVRRDVLLRAAALIEADAERLGYIGALENGLPRALVSARFATGAAGWFRYYAGWAEKIEGSVTADNERDGFIYTLLEPYGVVAVILTWNAPLFNLAMKIAPALAAGNSIVLKPAEFAPFSAMRCVDLLREAGLPDGVLNIVTGARAAGEALVQHPDVGKITFTGGAQTARAILRAAAENITPALLELGGKGANLVFSDADLDATAPFCVAAACMLTGQACAAPTRILAEASIYDAFIERLSAAADAFAIGDPLDDGTIAGPLISAKARENAEGFVGRAVRDGGRLVAGGLRPGGYLADGYFMRPAIVADVRPDSELSQHEVFGPVISVTRFKDEAEVIQMANVTRYGLVNHIQTKDIGRVLRLVRVLQSGGVAVNGGMGLHYSAPFGGVGLSGYGREGGRQGLDEFLRTKTVMIS